MAQKKALDSQAEKKAKEAKERAQASSKTVDFYEIAVKITNARKKNEEAFPSKDIETLVEMAIKVVAANF